MTISAQNSQTIQTVATTNNINPGLLQAVIIRESDGDGSAVSATGVQGIAQITQDTWKTLYPSGVPPYAASAYPNEQAYETAQITAGGKLLGQLHDRYGDNLAAIAAAYNGGTGTGDLVAEYMMPPRSLSAEDAVALAAQNVTYKDSKTGQILNYSPAKQQEIRQYVPRVAQTAISLGVQTDSIGDARDGGIGGGSGSSSGGTDQNPATSVNNDNPDAAVPLVGQKIPDDQIRAVVDQIDPKTLIISSGLGETPWFDDAYMVRPKHRAPLGIVPITFQVYFDNPDEKLGLKGRPPITIKLNCSLKQSSRTMRHIINRQQTRTGVLVTLWGMEPDVITGSGSTGVFMNQYGLTDFLSVTQVSAQTQAMIDHVFHRDAGGRDAGNIDAILSTYKPPTVVGPTETADPADGWRIAAKDAFVEFLALFRQNGMVWFQNQNYTGYTTGRDQLAPNAWSNKLGSTLFQNQSRRNDVEARGAVILTFRDTLYYGYFTNLGWQEDASKPFSWDFNFTFKVERTAKTIYLPEYT